MSTLIIRQGWLLDLIWPKRHVKLSKSRLEVIVAGRLVRSVAIKDLTTVPVTVRGWFFSSTTLDTRKARVSVSWLSHASASRLVESIKATQIALIKEALASGLNAHKQFINDEYPRDSSIKRLDEEFSKVFSLLSARDRGLIDALDDVVDNAVLEIADCYPLANNKEMLRTSFLDHKKTELCELLDNIESNPLTDSQKDAVLRNNDRNLVLSAAGTGKTSVMVAKTASLIQQRPTDDTKILLLAFGKEAANELQERISARFKSLGIESNGRIEVSTFHALGRKIIKTCEHPTRISTFVEDSKALHMWLTAWLESYVSSSPARIAAFINLSHTALNPFDFNSSEDYEAFVRDSEFRTIKGELVRGFQELVIANWLYRNGINYEYEPSYVSKRRVEKGFDYHPDFYLNDADVYLEHFGIDRAGNTRRGIDARSYKKIMQKKRQLHCECKTRLKETYHYEWVEGRLKDKLDAIVSEAGLQKTPRPEADILKTIKERGLIDEAAVRFLRCLRAIRVEGLSAENIKSRLHALDGQYNGAASTLLTDLKAGYEAELNEQGCIDFDDMIGIASTLTSSSIFKPTWDHILVDEFQDISSARMGLLTALLDGKPEATLTAVGDDWQSIFRFSGGKLELTTRFDQAVGPHCMTKIEDSFRYNQSIAETAGRFVMQNTEQYQKSVRAQEDCGSPAVILFDEMEGKEEMEELYAEGRALRLVKGINKKYPQASILVLARYNFQINNLKQVFSDAGKTINVRFSTLHSAKGAEADYAIIFGVNRGKFGFPSEKQGEPILEALLPSLDGFAHSEERRLFYVGLTRARKACLLLSDPTKPSAFVEELLLPKYEIKTASSGFELISRKMRKCPSCASGYFEKRTGQYGSFYVCSSGMACSQRPRSCGGCGSPSIDGRSESVCTDLRCGIRQPICDKCGRPMRLRKGRFGEFLGCSGYGISSDRCSNTRKLVTH